MLRQNGSWAGEPRNLFGMFLSLIAKCLQVKRVVVIFGTARHFKMPEGFDVCTRKYMDTARKLGCACYIDSEHQDKLQMCDHNTTAVL